MVDEYTTLTDFPLARTWSHGHTAMLGCWGDGIYRLNIFFWAIVSAKIQGVRLLRKNETTGILPVTFFIAEATFF